MPPPVGWKGGKRRDRSRRRLWQPYARDLRLVFRPVFRPEDFFGTLRPAALASDRPIAIACLRLLTVRPERPLFNVPALRFFIARSTVLCAFFEYLRVLRAIISLLLERIRSSAATIPIVGQREGSSLPLAQASAFSRRDAPELDVSCSRLERAQGKPGASDAPAASRPKNRRTRASHHRFTGSFRPSLRDWF